MTRKCRRCNCDKQDSEYSWQDKSHHWRDVYCHGCRAELRRLHRKPRCTVRPGIYPCGLGQKQNHHDHLTDTELAYVAGLVDGEGSIWSSYPKTGMRPLALVVSMIHRPTIEWLHGKCGGYVSPRRSNAANARQAWVWHLHGIRSGSLLKRIIPFMVTKREEAEVGLKLWATFWVNQWRGRLTEETVALRRRHGQELRDLKLREWVA